MSDQYQSADDPVAWGDWLASDQLDCYDSGSMANPQCFSNTAEVEEGHSHLGLTREPLRQEANNDAQSEWGQNLAPESEQAPMKVFNLRCVYPKSTCASCDASLNCPDKSLDVLDLYCTQSRTADHLPIACQQCGNKFPDIEALKGHCISAWHKCFKCAVSGCNHKVVPGSQSTWGGESSHFASYHPEIKYGCAQCGSRYDTHDLLAEHALQSIHTAYICRFPECGSGATRLTDLLRHQLTHRVNVPRHPCPHCRRHRGVNGFKRKDHLRQHIRNYHHIDAESQFGPLTYDCPREHCIRTGVNAFEDKKLLQLHLRKDHDSPYQCSQIGCDRVGIKGWMRQSDMVKHLKKVHGITYEGERWYSF